MIRIFTLVNIFCSLMIGHAFADDGDIFPDLAASKIRVRKEFRLAQKIYNTGSKDPAKVLEALKPGSYTCTYYLADYMEKVGAQLPVANGHLGSKSRAFTILGANIQLQLPKGIKRRDGRFAYPRGPWLQFEFDTHERNGQLRYVIEVRAGTHDFEGTIALAIRSGSDVFDRMVDPPQYLICNL